jgi:hypothetical protein
MHTTNPAGLALLVRDADLPARLQAWLPDVPVACAATPAELATLLGDPRWRAIAVEVAALDDRAEDLLPHLSSLFPDVPLIAIGGSADAHRLEPLVSAGCVQRFLHQPLGRRRTRTCVEAVLARPDGAVGAPTVHADRRAFAMLPAFAIRQALEAPPRARRALGALAVLAAVGLAIASGAGSSARTEAASTPVAAGALQTSGPGAGGAAQHAGKGGAARTAASGPAVDVSPLLAAADDARARGAVFEPGGDNAVHYYRQAIAAAPDDERARIALDRLGLALLSAGEQALAGRRFAEAAGRAGQAALVMGDDPRVRDLHSRVRAADEMERQRAAERRAAWARAAREWSAPPRSVVPRPQGATQLHQ